MALRRRIRHRVAHAFNILSQYFCDLILRFSIKSNLTECGKFDIRLESVSREKTPQYAKRFAIYIIRDLSLLVKGKV